MAKLIDINGFKATIKKVYEDIKVKADKSYVDQSITNLNIDQKANKSEVPAQANFTYQINMVASDVPASVETSGTYPDLIITFNIPQGTGGGGSTTEPDTGTPRMWYGFIPYDESGLAGFNSEEQIGVGVTKEVIQFGIKAGKLIETDPQVLGKTQVSGIIGGDYLCVIIPANSNYVATIDDGFGGKTSFATYGGTDNFNINGETLTNQIDGVSYKIYGVCILTDGTNYIYVDEI